MKEWREPKVVKSLFFKLTLLEKENIFFKMFLCEVWIGAARFLVRSGVVREAVKNFHIAHIFTCPP